MNQIDLEDAQMQGNNKAKQMLAQAQANWQAPIIQVLPKMIIASAPQQVQDQLKQIMAQKPEQGGSNALPDGQ